MIRSLRGRGLNRLYATGARGGIGADLVETVERILTLLDAASSPEALNLPRYRLHRLRGDRQGYWAVTVHANWRIVFRFENGDAFEVELVDYH